MSGSLNKVILIGRAGKDPEVRSTSAGMRLANLALATTETWREKQSGERKEKTEWHRVVIFNEKLVEIAEKYVRKGSLLALEGQLQTRKWTDTNTGQDRYTTEVVLQRFRGELTMLDSPGGNRERTGGGGDAFEARPKARTPVNDLDDDIPFITGNWAAEPYLKRRIVA